KSDTIKPRPAPGFSLKDLDGKEVSLEDLKGKVVVLDFWATWCAPCIKSFPAMQMAVDKYKEDPEVAFLFINTWERQEDPAAAVKQFMDRSEERRVGKEGRGGGEGEEKRKEKVG